VVKGPNPYLVAFLERTLVGVFGAYWLGWYRPYFVSLTDRRVLFFKLSLWTARSKGLDFAYPRDAVELVSFNRGRMWGAIKVRNPDGKVIRLNGPRIRWGHEMDTLAAALQGERGPTTTEPAVR